MEMTQEWITQFNKKCAEFLGIQIGYFKDEIDCAVAEYQWMCVSANCTYQFEKEDYPNKSVYDYLKFHSDWNWIMEVVDAIEKASKYTIMNKDVYSSFDIGKHSIKFYFSPNNNYLLHLELRQWLPDEIWKHSSYKHHIIKEFDFKKDGKKAAVVQAIDQFINWYNKQKEL